MSDRIIPTRKAAAKALGVTERTLADWVKEASFPTSAVGKDSRGRNRDWNITAIDRWRNEDERRGSKEDDKSSKLTQALKATRLRRERVRADREEREEQERRGNILSRDELAVTLKELITRTRNRLQNELPREISKAFPRLRKRVFEICELTVRKVLNDFARDLDEVELDLPQQK